MNLVRVIVRALLPQKLINIFYHLPKAVIANIFYDFPTRGLKVIGVTGTDGKTTTVNMIYQILKNAGKKVSMVSTINAVVAGKSQDIGFHVTSPDPFLVQKFAKVAADCGDGYLVLEVTSHGLDQFRFWGIRFAVGVITNITHEHLDYHKTFESYFNTKFKLVKNARFAVVNQALTKFRLSGKLSKGKVISFGLKNDNFSQKKYHLKLKIPGSYNLENALAALAVSSVLGIDQKIARKSLESFEGLTGRMEEVENNVLLRNRGIKIIIDFAHTPNGLRNALETLHSPVRAGRIISLIGCEGYRDVGKRSMMGEIAQKLSDIVIVTAVDPRGQMEVINRQIMEGAKRSGAKQDENFFIIEDRQQAVNFAINKLAQRGDTVVLFGKGHERSMNLDGKGEIAWSDEKAVKMALKGDWGNQGNKGDQ